MTDLLQTIKEKPVLSVGSAATVIGACVWVALWGWNEFAHAADLARVETKTVREIQINRIGSEISLLELQIRDSRNRARELTVKQKLTAGEMALAQQYNSDVSGLEAEKRQKQRLLDQIKAGEALK